MTSPTNDLVVLTPTFGPITPSDELLDSVAAFVAKRLEISAIAIPSLEPDALQKLNRLDASVSQPETSVVRRVVLIPCGFAPLKLSDLRTARWFSGLSSSSKCYLADPWTPKEVGEWIGREVMRPKSSRGPNGEIILPLDRSMSLEEVERWALIAFWGNRGCDSTKPRIVLEEPSNETKQSTSSKPPPWPWKCDPESFDAEDLSTWCIQRTLSA